MRIRKLDKTATVCWSPGQHEPLLAVGTVAGALDASFSSRTELELYSLNLDTSKGKMVRLGGVESNSRFNRLDWGSTGKGLIACGKENGELDIFSADRILSKKDPLVFRGNHAGPVRGLNFNPLQPQLASGGPDGEILIWDLNEFKSFEPGARSQRLEDITTLAWNRQVPHILATASNNGYTVVWDLRNRKEILKLPYPGGRRPITAVSWNPDAPTQLVLAGDDDANPMLYMWDLRNASAPERMLAGHTKGILSVDWCNKDSDLILSCGKDNRTIVWNASTAEPIGDLAHSANWSFDVKWCPRNPDLSVVASYDGKVSIHSLQSSSEQVDDVFSPPPPQHQEIVDPNDPFAQVMQQQIPQHVDETHFVLPHPPKWLKRPSGCRFSFGGQLVSFKNTGVSIHTIAAEKSFSDRVDHLEAALMAEAHDLNQYCHHMAKKATESDKDIWNYLATLFSETQQTDILDFVGFDGNRSSEVQRLLEKMVIEAPEKEPEQFNLFSTIKSEETDLDNYITKAVIVGDFELAVHLCLGSNRLSDALVLAYNGGEELLFKTQQEIFKRSKKPYLRLLNAIVSDDLKDVVEHCKVDQWKQILALISSYSKPEEYHGLCSLLGERLQSTPKPDTHAASLCFIGSGEFDRVVNLWLPAVERQKTLEKSNKEHYYLSLQQFVEKVSVLKAAIGFEDQELPYQLEEGESYTLEKLYGHLAKYCLIAANQGKLDACWRVLEMIPPSYGHETLDILRDRVYKSLNVAMGVTGQFPPFPFESVTVVGEQKPKEQYAYQPQNTQKPPVVNPFQPAVNRSSFQTQPFAPQQSYQPPSNPYQPPVNQFQPPPVVNQFQPPVNQFQPPVQQFQPAPVAPPPVQQFQPATNNQFQQSTQVNQLQPPSGFQQTPFIPQGPQRSGSFSAPQVSATTGHGQPIASTFQPPVFGVQSPVSPTVTKPLPEVKKETDRSQYTPAQRKVFDGLQAQWTKASASQTASEKRMIEDAEKRLELLYGQMHRQETPAQVVEELDQLVHGIVVDCSSGKG
ncbi:WD40-repeat-containing domain protein [Gorgonomyces haynaldii]|nr:WD40-repeat-containing domain protein [Gorgonomyces haynaldii]